jgi:SH3-like domain-containing protein
MRLMHPLRLAPMLLMVLTMLLAPPLLSMPGTSAQAREMMSVARPGINMRAGPGTRHDALWRLARGYPVEIIARKGSWYKVRDFERDIGWIHRPLLAEVPHHVVKAGTANIRSGPGTASRIIGKAAYGDVVRTIEKHRQWVRVRNESGLVGWISRRLLWGW